MAHAVALVSHLIAQRRVAGDQLHQVSVGCGAHLAQRLGMATTPAAPHVFGHPLMLDRPRRQRVRTVDQLEFAVQPGAPTRAKELQHLGLHLKQLRAYGVDPNDRHRTWGVKARREPRRFRPEQVARLCG